MIPRETTVSQGPRNRYALNQKQLFLIVLCEVRSLAQNSCAAFGFVQIREGVRYIFQGTCPWKIYELKIKLNNGKFPI